MRPTPGNSFGELLTAGNDESGGKRNAASQHMRNRGCKLYANGRFFHVATDPAESKPLDPATLDATTRATYERLKAELDQRVKECAEADPKMIQFRKRYADLKL